MAKKCEFCAKQGADGGCLKNPIINKSYEGSDYCEQAAIAYKKYMLAQVSGRNTRTVNINKNYKKGSRN